MVKLLTFGHLHLETERKHEVDGKSHRFFHRKDSAMALNSEKNLKHCFLLYPNNNVFIHNILINIYDFVHLISYIFQMDFQHGRELKNTILMVSVSRIAYPTGNKSQMHEI